MGGKESQFTPEPCSILSDTVVHTIRHSQVMFIHIKNALWGAGIGLSQLPHQPAPVDSSLKLFSITTGTMTFIQHFTFILR